MDEEGELRRTGRVAGHRFLLHQQRSIQGPWEESMYTLNYRSVRGQFCQFCELNGLLRDLVMRLIESMDVYVKRGSRLSDKYLHGGYGILSLL